MMILCCTIFNPISWMTMLTKVIVCDCRIQDSSRRKREKIKLVFLNINYKSIYE